MSKYGRLFSVKLRSPSPGIEVVSRASLYRHNTTVYQPTSLFIALESSPCSIFSVLCELCVQVNNPINIPKSVMLRDHH